MMRKLECFAFGSGSSFEAVCLDFDLAVTGNSFREVYDLLTQAINSYVDDALKENEDTARKLLSRRAPLSVRVGYRLSYAAHMFARRFLNGGEHASFDLACRA